MNTEGDVASPRATVEFARTSDGWDLALHHYCGTRADLPPVILCGGYACNRHFIDFDEDYSLARFLARRGFDAWVLELRGRGYSEPASGRRRRGWTFDDLVRYDATAAIAHVRARAGDRAPVWIGHSMGGMVMYAALGHDATVRESIAGLVTMASPVAFPSAASSLARTIGGLLLAMPLPEYLPQQNVLSALWLLASRSPRAAEFGMNPANIDRRAFSAALHRFICNVPRRKLRQFIRWSLTGTFRSGDDAIDYRANLQRITTPVFVIAGASDRLASPEVVGFAYDRIGSTRKQYREFAARHGDHADYGHVDLVFGRRAPEEVFPVVSSWIEREIAGR
ncbi:MAG TPA: alpha/beta fold hydrolase [Candidatus Binatia bacterium]|nr:alpha/beta fold hydrolase [Candidatus Binatia bacterium]